VKLVKSVINIVATLFVVAVGAAVGIVVMAQQPPPVPPPDPTAPALTLEEKIALTTDDLKKQDILDRAQKTFLAEIKPIQEHQDAAKASIEKEHEGWQLVLGQGGWYLVKKVAAPKPEAAKPSK
jgi:hypothetical protein